jgi:hypothetical protein
VINYRGPNPYSDIGHLKNFKKPVVFDKLKSTMEAICEKYRFHKIESEDGHRNEESKAINSEIDKLIAEIKGDSQGKTTLDKNRVHDFLLNHQIKPVAKKLRDFVIMFEKEVQYLLRHSLFRFYHNN